MKNTKGKLGFITFIVSYVVVHIIFKLFDFEYNIFSEPFNILKFIIDFGSWIIIWGLVYFTLKKLKNS